MGRNKELRKKIGAQKEVIAEHEEKIRRERVNRLRKNPSELSFRAERGILP
jgi:hypothetical protein